jgi:hypothetical protein
VRGVLRATGKLCRRAEFIYISPRLSQDIAPQLLTSSSPLLTPLYHHLPSLVSCLFTQLGLVSSRQFLRVAPAISAKMATIDHYKGSSDSPNAKTEYSQEVNIASGEDVESESGHHLHRGLQARQIGMIAIGGAIGTGLIIGT